MSGSVQVVQLSEGKELAKIMSSNTAKQIIEYIGEHEDCTASDVVKHLELPASTVHYNLKALTQANILDDSQYTYSSKGKTVVHYRLANKVIIIVPQKEGKNSLVSQLSTILPGLLGVVALAGVAFFTGLFRSSQTLSANKANIADATIMETELFMADALPRAAATPQAQEGANAVVSTAASSGLFSSQLALGLLIGAGIILIGALVVIVLKKRKQQ